jgi:hypothetical protein
MIDVVALGELLIDFACLNTDAEGYPTMAAHPGGAPANFLAALTKFGAKTALLGKVGTDAFGKLLTGTLEKAGIETRGLIATEDVFTTLAFVTFDENGDPYSWQSINHHFLGDISHYFISDIAGIRVNDNFKDAKNIDIVPTFIDELDNAKAYFDSVCGRVEVQWEKKGNKALLKVDLPEGIYGEIKADFADGEKVKNAVSGVYEIVIGE